jgi:hypothetical protein
MALKTIQRWWRRKFVAIQNESASRLQRFVRASLAKVRATYRRLEQIRQKLLQIRLRRALRLYVKTRRMRKQRPAFEFLSSKDKQVRRIQGLVRCWLAKKAAGF